MGIGLNVGVTSTPSFGEEAEPGPGEGLTLDLQFSDKPTCPTGLDS